MADLNYPDHFYADALKTIRAYNARKLYDETTATAAAQDGKLDSISDIEARILTARASLRNAMELLDAASKELAAQRVAFVDAPADNVPHWDARWGKGIPAESAYLASFSPNGSRIATPAEIDGLRDVLSAEELRGFGIGDAEPRHPMHAEAIRDHDERLSGPGPKL